MFAIYDLGGLRFRDTLEKLRRVQPTTAADGLAPKPSLVDHNTQPESFSITNNTSDKLVSHQAQKAYKEMLHLNKREPIVHAYQLMSNPVRTVTMEMDILSARKLFQQQKFQQMPVMNMIQCLVGILSVQNLLQFIMMDGEQVHYVRGKRVSDVMSSSVITADPVSDIRRVASIMLEYKLHGVPIVDQHDVLMGIVSRSDILRAVTNEPPLTMWS